MGSGQACARLREIAEDRVVYDVNYFGGSHESCTVELPAVLDRDLSSSVLDGVPHRLVRYVLLKVWRERESTGRWPLTSSWAS